MKIVHVLDLYDQPYNGVATATKRNVKLLQDLGHEVRILSTGEPATDKIVVDKFSLPFFQHLVDAQGFTFAKPDDSKYFAAFNGADIVHFHLPTPFCIEGEKIARQMGITTVSSFHLQPQNITYSIGLGTNDKINDRLYSDFRKHFYSKFNYIHAPSRMIANQLIAHDYKAEVRVISNGVSNIFKPMQVERAKQFEDKFLILTVGRLSGEKRQDLVIEAVKQSKYQDKIQLVFAGQGPERENLEELSKNLTNKPVFDFYSQEDLVKLMNQADLYIHASDAEIEGISCLEAMACGLVPIISDSKLSATNNFSLTENSLFTAGNANSLAEKIEYWIDNPAEKASYSKKYAEKTDGMRVENTIQDLVKLYQDALRKQKKYGYPKIDEPHHQDKIKAQKEKKKFAKPRLPGKIRVFFTRQAKKFISFIAYVILFILYGVKVKGRKNLALLDNEGGISIMNHIHNMDSSMAAVALSPENVTFVSTSANFKLPVIGKILKLLGVIPTPSTYSSAKDFVQVIQHKLKKNNIVHFFPEGYLLKNFQGLRDFRNGAFYFAIKENKAILPMAIRLVKSRKGKQRWLTGKPRYFILIGEPLYPNPNLSRKCAIEDLKRRSYKSVNSLVNEEIEVADRFITFDLTRIAAFIAVIDKVRTLL
ncbi:MAG: glycosyltransferase [Clostridiaceae bacterium]|nr:glycosyltransferase [Clostridiaceae bacterium]